jgi:hypothetical protein
MQITLKFFVFLISFSISFTVRSQEIYKPIDQEAFNQIIFNTQILYLSEIQNLPTHLTISKIWDSPISNAYAEQLRETNELKLEFHGEWTKTSKATYDSFVALVCHEFGHILGGAPRLVSRGFRNSQLPIYLSTEGQADYFAASKCLKKYFTTFHSQESTNFAQLNEYPYLSARNYREIKRLCHETENEELCLRVFLAGHDMLQNYASIFNNPNFFNIYPIPRSVSLTVRDGYPIFNCRVWTYLSGALCSASIESNFSPFDPNENTCDLTHPLINQRPRCWYSPSDNEDQFTLYN